MKRVRRTCSHVSLVVSRPVHEADVARECQETLGPCCGRNRKQHRAHHLLLVRNRVGNGCLEGLQGAKYEDV